MSQDTFFSLLGFLFDFFLSLPLLTLACLSFRLTSHMGLKGLGTGFRMLASNGSLVPLETLGESLLSAYAFKVDISVKESADIIQ